MPVIVAEIADPVGLTGETGDVTSDLLADVAEEVGVYGLPAVVLTPDSTPSPIQDSVRARVLDENGTFIANLPYAKGLQWLDEFNGAGSGSIDIQRYDELEIDFPTLWQPGNQIVISVGALDVFRLVLDAEPGYRIDGATGHRQDTWGGMGALGVLNSGMIFPEYGFRPEGTENRSFDYGSDPTKGGWIVPREWKTPVGKLVRKSWRWTHKKRRLPKGWPDRRAQWIWWKNPDSRSVPDETCYFRSSITLGSRTRVKFWVAGDDSMEFQVDGEVRLATGKGKWVKPSTFTTVLSAGTHYIAARVTNSETSDGSKNRSGFIMTCAKVDNDGDVKKWLRRTNTTAWVVRRQLSAPPGWLPSQILLQLIGEAKARGCAGHAAVTYGFSASRDSAGAGWPSRLDMSFPVGTLGLDLIQKMTETGVDIAMTPGLQLNMWRSRGSNLSGRIRLDQDDSHPLDEGVSQLPGIRNVVYARATSGWVGRDDSASISASGRRETFVSLGSALSPDQTSRFLAAMLPDLAGPPVTVEVQVAGTSGPQPYRDYNVGDWVGYRPAGQTTWTPHRVMSISGEVTEAGHPAWTLQLYGG